ncbi:MAG: hypothetical protein QOG49_712 [Frankiaceae bacterium]|nr:hypothetical protein [Frankiaceae bacterium]
MTGPGDDLYDMRRNLEREDRDLESMLRGHVPADRPELEPIAALISELRASARTPAPPSAALAAVLANGLPETERDAVAAGRSRRRAVSWAAAVPAVTWARFSSLRTAAKAAAIASVAALSFTSAAFAGALPDAIQEKVSTAVETVTPWNIPHPAGGGGIGKLVREKARHHGQTKDKTKPSEDPTKDAVETESPDTGKPTNPGNSDHSTKPKASHSPEADASESGKPTHPVKPSTPGDVRPTPAPGRPADPGSNGRANAGQHATPGSSQSLHSVKPKANPHS